MATDKAMEALEKRFAAAKSELDLNEKKNNSTNQNPKRKEPISEKSSSVAPVKGNFIFAGYSGSEDFDINDPTYFKLSQSVHENLMPNVNILGRKGSKVDTILHELFQKGDSGQKYMQGSRNKRIDNWIMLDNCVQRRCVSNGSRTKALQVDSKRSKVHMSMKQHKKHGSLDLPKEFHKYEIFSPMHESWRNYMTQLLKKSGKNQLAQCLLDAELHGAIISVVDCKIASLTGVSGIIIRETAETFGIITKGDKVRVVPKKSSVFVFQVDCYKITLLGDKLNSRNKTFTHQT